MRKKMPVPRRVIVTGRDLIGSIESLEARTLFSTYAYHDALSGLGVNPLVGENGPPLPPQGVEYSGYGHAAVALGDIDDDGFGDYAVAAPGDAGRAVAGAVFVRSGRTGDVLHTLADGAAGFGTALAAMGDVDHDGVADLAVGSPRYDSNRNALVDPAGRVWIFSGATGEEIISFDGTEAFSEFGAAIAATADRDNDGVLDLLVGAPLHGENDRGRATLFSTLGFALLWAFEGKLSGEHAGAAVAASDRDSRFIAIGSPAASSGTNGAGLVRVFDAAGAQLYERSGREANDAYGTSLAFLLPNPALGADNVMLVVGAPGVDRIAESGPKGQHVFGSAPDRGAAEALLALTGESRGWIGGPKAVGARFGAMLIAAGDLDGDGAEDLGVSAPGDGPRGAAIFFRHMSPGLRSFASEWDLALPGSVGVPRLTDVGGRGLGAVGDVNADGFPDVLIGDGFETARLVGAYALGDPVLIDGASPTLSRAWSNSLPRPFVVINGEIRAFSRVAGLVQPPPGDLAATRSVIEAMNDAGDIVFRNQMPVAPETWSELFVLNDGVVSTLGERVDSVEGGSAPNYARLSLGGLSNAGHLLLNGDGAWILHDGVLTLTPFDHGVDVNSSGLVLGVAGPGPGVWMRGGALVAISGLEDAGALSESGAVAGVIAGTRTADSPGRLGTWRAGAVTDLGAPSGSFGSQGGPRWMIQGVSDAGAVLAEIRQEPLAGPARHTTFVASVGNGVQLLFDRTHGISTRAEEFGGWDEFPGVTAQPSILTSDGRIAAYRGVLAVIDDAAPWVLRADSATANSSPGAAHFSAAINQFGELIVFTTTGSGTSARRLSARVVAPGNTDLVMYLIPGSDTSTAGLAIADAGRLNVYRLTPGVIAGPVDISGTEGDLTATPIVDRLTVFTNTAGVVHLAGIDPRGDLVIHYLVDPSDPTGRGNWWFDNLTRGHLVVRGLDTPAFVSELTAFSTAWGTMHIAGLDAAGHVNIVWWAPDSPLWRTDDLTAAAAEARPMVDRVSSFVTPWSTLHINGADESGRVVSLWWAPGFTTWRLDQLAPSGSLQLVPGTITSYVTPWGGLNVVGRDAVSGRATSYWWAPESNMWSVEVLRTTNGAQGPRLAGEIAAGASTTGTLSVFGRGLDGHAMRLFWNPGDAGIWTMQDLTELV